MKKIFRFHTESYILVRGRDSQLKDAYSSETIKHKHSCVEYHKIFSSTVKKIPTDILKCNQHDTILSRKCCFSHYKPCNDTTFYYSHIFKYYSLMNFVCFRRNFHFNCCLFVETAKQQSSGTDKTVHGPYLNDKNGDKSLPQVKEKEIVPGFHKTTNEKLSVHDVRSKALDKSKASPLEGKNKSVKVSIGRRIINEIKHFYHGFKLLFYDIYVSSRLLFRLAKGQSLRRREKRLLMRTIGDIFRLIPFSVIILVPFMELLLPVLLKLFPGMLPSTFQTKADKEQKMKQTLKVKLEMAKFLQDTLQDMTSKHKCVSCAKETHDFADLFEKVRSGSKGAATNEEIIQFSRLFSDNITLDTLPRPQLIALCRVLEIQTFGTTSFLRFQLEMRLRNLAADDKLIQKEGVKSLDIHELQQACKARGMRGLGLTEKELQTQLQQWIDLSMDSKVPPSLLLLSRVFMLHDHQKSSQSEQIEHIAKAISHLPESAAIQAKESAGIVSETDNKMRMDILKHEYKIVSEEIQEDKEENRRIKQQQKEIKKVDDGKQQYPYIKGVPVQVGGLLICRPAEKTIAEDTVTSSDISAIYNAAHSMGAVATVDKGELIDLKEKLENYRVEIEELKPGSEDETLRTVAEQRLYKVVDNMTVKIDLLVKDISSKKGDMKNLSSMSKDSEEMKKELLKLDEVLNVVKKLQKFPNNWRLKIITEMLSKMVVDKQSDSIKVDTLIKAVDLLGKENFHLSQEQIEEVIEMIKKEEFLDIENKVEKNLQEQNYKEEHDRRSSSPTASVKKEETETEKKKL